MNRTIVLFTVGLAFGAVALTLKLSGILAGGAVYVSILGICLGFAAAWVALEMAHRLDETRRADHHYRS